MLTRCWPPRCAPAGRPACHAIVGMHPPAHPSHERTHTVHGVRYARALRRAKKKVDKYHEELLAAIKRTQTATTAKRAVSSLPPPAPPPRAGRSPLSSVELRIVWRNRAVLGGCAVLTCVAAGRVHPLCWQADKKLETSVVELRDAEKAKAEAVKVPLPTPWPWVPIGSTVLPPRVHTCAYLTWRTQPTPPSTQ